MDPIRAFQCTCFVFALTAVACGDDPVPADDTGTATGQVTEDGGPTAGSSTTTSDEADGSADWTPSDETSTSTGSDSTSDSASTGARTDGTSGGSGSDSGSSTAAGESSSGGNESSGSESSGTAGITCPPEDGASIGLACNDGGPCPECYTCQGFSGIVFQESCQILCEPDDPSSCPAGLSCTMIEDKTMMPWWQCV